MFLISLPQVFLDLGDNDIVNLHGIPQSYTICEPDPNLPTLPKVFYNHGGTFVQKMMDSTFGTLKKKKKELVPKEEVPIKAAGSMTDLSDASARSDHATPIPKILEPLKNKQEDTPTYCKVMLRPATVEKSSDDSNGMSLFDFLSTMSPVADSNDTRLGLPAKSPLFSSYHELRTAAERPVSVLSDGNNSMSHPVKHRRRGSLFSFIDSINHRGSRVSTESHNSSVLSRNSMFSTASDMSSSISSLSMDRPKTDPQRMFQGWADPDGNSSQCDSASDTSLHSSSSSIKTKHHYSPNHRHSPQPHNSPLHSSIMFGRSLSPDQSPSLTDSTTQVDIPDGADSPVNDGSYSCEQVAVVSTVHQHVEQDDISTSYSPTCSNVTVTPTGPHTAQTSSSDCSNTVKEQSSVIDTLSLSPLTQTLKVPLASTPKKSPPGNIKLSKSMGNMADDLFFMDDEETDATSLGEFMQKELSCLDSTNSRTNFQFSSQDDLSSSSNSQRDALESSTHSSSLDFSFSQPSPSISYRQHKPPGGDPLGALLEESGEHRLSPRTSRTLYVIPTSSENQLSPYQKHKWSSMDNLKTSAKIDEKKS